MERKVWKNEGPFRVIGSIHSLDIESDNSLHEIQDNKSSLLSYFMSYDTEVCKHVFKIILILYGKNHFSLFVLKLVKRFRIFFQKCVSSIFER